MNKLFLIPRGIIIFLVLLNIITLLGCAPNQAYSSADSSKNSLPGQYLLHIVEFDDQGQFHNRKQLSTLLEKLAEEVKTHNLLIVTFVHGWNHNAEETDSNLKNFKELLKKISDYEQEQDKRRIVVGVYLGWRGKSISIPFLDILTFWDRKNTAETIGIQGGVTETLLELEKVVRPDFSVEKEGSSRLVIIGHSFGGLIVYSALAPVFLQRAVEGGSISRCRSFTCHLWRTFFPQRAVEGDPIIDGVGDLVILVNPAFEALRFANLRQSFYSRKKGNNDEQPPLMVVLTSENDKATKIAFPVGRFISTIMDSYREDEFTANRTAIGHYKPFENSTLNPICQGEISSVDSQECKTSEKQGVCFTQCPKVVLESECSKPYLVTKVHESIIPDHNKIWDKESKILPLIRYLILSKPDRDCIVDNSDYCTEDQTEPFPTSYNGKRIKTKKLELIGFQQLLNKNWECAERAFNHAYKIWPAYHNVEEILDLLKRHDGSQDYWALYEEIAERAFNHAYKIWPTYHHNVKEILDLLKRHDGSQDYCALYKEITQKYSWGMPQELKKSFQQSIKECP